VYLSYLLADGGRLIRGKTRDLYTGKSFSFQSYCLSISAAGNSSALDGNTTQYIRRTNRFLYYIVGDLFIHSEIVVTHPQQLVESTINYRTMIAPLYVHRNCTFKLLSSSLPPSSTYSYLLFFEARPASRTKERTISANFTLLLCPLLFFLFFSLVVSHVQHPVILPYKTFATNRANERSLFCVQPQMRLQRSFNEEFVTKRTLVLRYRFLLRITFHRQYHQWFCVKHFVEQKF
jgi:hypothetical protein